MRYIALFTSCLIVATPSIAARGAVVEGPGFAQCGTYLKMRDDKNASAGFEVTAWVMGYVAGYNQYSKGKQVTLPHYETILAYMDKHCRNNPLDRVIHGTYALISELGGDPSK